MVTAVTSDDGTGWAKPAQHFADRIASRRASARGPASGAQPDRLDQLEQTGISWNSNAVEWHLIERTTVDRVRARYRASLAAYIWDAAALEGNPYTLPEVQTLLEGITVSGRRLQDQQQILALNDAYNTLDQLVAGQTYRLDKATSDVLHGQLAVHEAIESGHFRGEGSVGGGGLVSLGALGQYRASAPGAGGVTLIYEFDDLLRYVHRLGDPREQALAYFCAATRRQFYFDGNKRTARLMMTGHLMTYGYDAISISATRRLEFNEKLSTMFDTGDATEMMRFIVDCRPEG